jgi:fatty acid-binding protein DegV
MIQLVTDSASMLPGEVRGRFGIDVVALTITIDGVDFREERLATELPGSEIVVYEVGPSVGAHTGPGTLGVVYTPV